MGLHVLGKGRLWGQGGGVVENSETLGIGRPSTRKSRVSASLSIHFIFLNQLPPVRIKQAVHTLNPNLKLPVSAGRSCPLLLVVCLQDDL